MSDEKKYDADNIQVLEGLEAVRKRPSMYIGSTDSRGLHHLVYEVVDNSIDEALAGYAKNIKMTINEDGSITVIDDGRGIPVDMHPKYQKSALEVVLTVLHAGGKFDKESYKVSGGLHGVGVSVVNALSECLTAEVHRDGKQYRQTYAYGIATSDVELIGDAEGTGTTIHFMPDKKIFETTDFKYDILLNRLKELAFLNRGIRIITEDNRVLKEEEDEEFGNIAEDDSELVGNLEADDEDSAGNNKKSASRSYIVKEKYHRIDVENNAELLHLLAECKNDITDIEIRKGTLNDVFLEITGREIREGGDSK